MSECFPRKHNAALNREIEGWHQKGIISEEQLKVLLPLYPPAAPHSGKLIGILMNLGAILIGLGGLLFIAANWQYLTAPIKVFLIFLSIGASNYAGWRLRFEPGDRPILGTSLLLLGSLFYGGGIWLMSQIFNYDTSLSNGLLLWALGTSASALATGCAPIGVLSALLMAVWTVTSQAGITGFSLALAASLFIAYKLRSPWTCVAALTAGGIWTSIVGKTFEYGLIFYGSTLFLSYLWHRKRWQLMAAPYMYIGTTSALLGLLIMTCDRASNFSAIEMPTMVALFISCLTMGVLASLEDKSAQSEVLGSLSVSILALLLALVDTDLSRLLGGNIVFLCAMVALVWTGVNRLQSVAIVNVTIVFFVFDIIARYFDVFFSMLDRSLFFILGGVVLMAAGAVAERSRRKILEGLAT